MIVQYQNVTTAHRNAQAHFRACLGSLMYVSENKGVCYFQSNRQVILASSIQSYLTRPELHRLKDESLLGLRVAFATALSVHAACQTS